MRPPDTAAAFVSPFQFGRSSSGQYFVVDPFGEVGITSFAQDGKYERRIGKRGDGPGEFRFIQTFVVGTADTVHVFGERESIFDQRGRFVTSRALPKPIRATGSFSHADGRIFLLGNTGTESEFGIPFHILTRHGSIERSFGPQLAESAGASIWDFRTAIAKGRGNYFWSSFANRYAIERWSEAGELQRVYERRVSWFDPWKRWDSRSDLRAPPARLVSFMEDDKAILWTLLLVKDAHWAVSAGASLRSEPAYPTVNQQEARFDTIIEAVDVKSGDLLASRRLPTMHVALFGEGLSAQTVESATGELTVRVFKLSLSGRTR